MSNLSRLISDNPPSVEDPFHYLNITANAYKKANLYGKIVAVGLNGSEAIGFMLSSRNDEDIIVRDVVLVKQEGTHVSTNRILDNKSYGNSLESYKIIGWFHTHPGFGGFHSSTDKGEMRKILHEIAVANRVRKIMPRRIIANTCDSEIEMRNGRQVLVIKEQEGPHKLEIYLPDVAIRKKQCHDPPEIIYYDTEDIAFAYSMVLGLDGEKSDYAEVQTKRWCAKCSTSKLDDPIHIGLRLIKQDSDIDIDLESLISDVRENIHAFGFEAENKVRKYFAKDLAQKAPHEKKKPTIISSVDSVFNRNKKTFREK